MRKPRMSDVCLLFIPSLSPVKSSHWELCKDSAPGSSVAECVPKTWMSITRSRCCFIAKGFSLPKRFGLLEFIPCGFRAQKKQFRAIRRIPVTVCQASRAELHDNAPLQSPIHSSSILCPQQPHPGQPRKQVLPQNLRIPWGHSQMTPATH